MTRMNRSGLAAGIIALLTAVLGLSFHTGVAHAIDGDVRAGLYPDVDGVSVGAGILTDLGRNSGWYFNPNVEVAMGDRRDIVAVSGDLHYDFNQTRNTSVWVGAGPAVLVTNREVGDDDTDLGLNLLTGIGAKRGSIRPFAQLRGTLTDDSQIAVAGGIRF